MDTLTKINHIVENQVALEREAEQKVPQYKYEVYIVGDDKVVTAAALQLNKRVGAHSFNHVVCVAKVNVLRFESPIPGVPVRDILKRLNFKTRRYSPTYVVASEADLRNGTEDSGNAPSEPETQAEGLCENAESPVLGDSSVLDSERSDVQVNEADEQQREPQDSQA